MKKIAIIKAYYDDGNSIADEYEISDTQEEFLRKVAGILKIHHGDWKRYELDYTRSLYGEYLTDSEIEAFDGYVPYHEHIHGIEAIRFLIVEKDERLSCEY